MTPIMRKRDQFQSQDQRHNRKKEKKDRKTDSDQQNEEADRYESSDSEYEIQLAVPVQRRTSIEDSREPTVREEATQPERVTLHPKLRRVIALSLDQAIRKRIQKIQCEYLIK